MKTDLKDKIRGCMMGGAIGDALGYPIEFEIGLKPGQVKKFSKDRGLISDDTQMSLFTACGLLWRETRWQIRGIAMLPHEAVYLAWQDWLGTQQRTDEHQHVAWVRKLPELNVMREPGNTCIEALSSGTPGEIGRPINDSKGAGGVMRVAPFGVMVHGAGEFAARSCAMTHGHSLAILSAFVFAEIIYGIIHEELSIEKAVDFAILAMKKWEVAYYQNSRKKRLDWSAEKAEVSGLVLQALELAKSDTPEQEAISKLGEGWVAEEALAIAVFCSARHENDFEKAVVAAVNHDGDSDTTGSMTGNIVGAALGLSKIPEYYREKIELKSTILEIADDMASGVPVDRTGQVSDPKWLTKYLYAELATEESLGVIKRQEFQHEN